MGVLQSQIGTEQLNLVHGHVLLVEHEELFSEEFKAGLDCLSHHLTRVSGAGASEAMAKIVELAPDVVLIPHTLSTMTGLQFVEELRATGNTCGIVMAVPAGSEEIGAQALEIGAQDFLVHPLRHEQVVATLSLVIQIRQLAEANDTLQRRLNDLKSGCGLVGCCPASRRLTTALARAAESSVTVLVEGPPGAGKTLAAQVIHTSSRLSAKRQEVTYGDTLTAERIDHILADDRIGTLLLENVDQLLPDVQSRVVKYIKERSAGNPVERQGVRIIATTSAHLPELVARGKFREDLYYRLNVFPVNVPALRERREDITALADHFLSIAAERHGDQPKGFTEAAVAMLESHSWPGNIAQLQDVVVRAYVLARGAQVDRKHLQGVATGLGQENTRESSVVPAITTSDNGPVTEEDILPLETEEKRLLARALKATKGNVRRAAQLLRIGRATLYRKIQVYKLKLN